MAFIPTYFTLSIRAFSLFHRGTLDSSQQGTVHNTLQGFPVPFPGRTVAMHGNKVDFDGWPRICHGMNAQ